MAKKTVKKSNITVNGTNAADVITITGSSNRIYAKGGNDKITLNKGQSNYIDAGAGNDTIIIGKKAGDNNTFIAGKGNDTITVSGGKQIIDGGAGADKITVAGGTQDVSGGAGNDNITVSGGNNHTLRGGAGSDKYIVNVAMSKNTLLTIDQSDAGKKDKDVLQLSKVSKNDVKMGVANGTLSIKHKTGGGIIVEGYDKKLSKIQFKDGTMNVSAVQKTSKKTKATAVTWNKGETKTLDAKNIVSELQVTGHKGGDFVATVNSKGQLVLREKDGDKGTLTIKNWNSNTVSKFVFKVGNYTRTYTAEEFKARTYTLTPLKDNAVYTGGQDVNQEFQVNFSPSTNIVIDTSRSGGNRDRISFTNDGGWSNEHDDLFVSGDDLYLWNWNPNTLTDDPGQIVIKNFMRSSVREIEFSNQTYRLITGTGTWSGSDTYSDRFMILDRVKTGEDPNVPDWDVTLENVRANDVIDLRSLFVNSRYYSLGGTQDGQDMVLSYWYSPTTTSDTKLGTLRLKNYFNADGSVNTTNGYPMVRLNREFYAGDDGERQFDGFTWNRIKGTSPEKNYRRQYVNAGTAGADTVDLGTLEKPNSKYVWMYYALDGDDTVTAQAGDIAYGGNGDDMLYARGCMIDLFGGAGNDIITVRAADDSNLDHVNVNGQRDNDVIEAWGSYHFLAGGSGNDDINIHGNGHTSCLVGGSGDDLIYIEDGYDHRGYGSNGNDTITVVSGHDHQLYGSRGEDSIKILKDVTNSEAHGGNDNDELYVEGGADNIWLYGGSGNDVFAFDDTYNSYTGNNYIADFEYGSDVIRVADATSITNTEVIESDTILTLNGGGKVKIIGADAGLTVGTDIKYKS